MYLWKHEIANVVDEVYRKGSKLFGDVLWQIVIGIKFNVRFFFIGKLKPKFEGIGARTLDLDHDAELHCHLTFLLSAVPDRTPGGTADDGAEPRDHSPSSTMAPPAPRPAGACGRRRCLAAQKKARG